MDQRNVFIHERDGSEIASVHIGYREELGDFMKRILDKNGLNLANFDMIFVRRRDFDIQSIQSDSDFSSLDNLPPARPTDPEEDEDSSETTVSTDEIGEGKIHHSYTSTSTD